MAKADLHKKTLKIFLLGQFKVHLNGERIPTSPTRSNKTWLVFKLLLTHKSRRVASDVLIQTFWPDGTADTARQALYTCVHRLRSALSAAGIEDLITAESGFYGINPGAPLWVDAEEFDNLVQRALSVGSGQREELLRQALDLYRGDFLPEHLEDDWARPAQIHYRAVYHQAVIAYSDLLIQTRRLTEARSLLETALILEPLEEEFHVRYLDALWESNLHNEAARHYRQVGMILYNEIGVQPSPKMQALLPKLNAVPVDEVPMNLESFHESLAAAEQQPGPFFCNREEFLFLCRLEQRQIERREQGSVIVSLRVATADPTAQQNLHTVFEQSLRRGDIICHWSENLFFLLFPEITKDIVQKIMRRIYRRFLKYYEDSPPKLSVRLKTIAAVNRQ